MKTRKIVPLLIALLGFANTMMAQTLLDETFGTSELPVTFYTGGTSVPAVDYTESPQVAPLGYVSTVFSTYTSPDACLLFKSTGTARRANMTAPLPTSTGLSSVLTDNTRLVTWTVNMKSSRLSTNQFSAITGFPEAKYFNATVLCASNSTVIGEVGTGNGTDGYAVIVQKSSADATRTSIGLIKFHNGIGVLASEGSVLTRLIESPVLVNPTSTLLLSSTNPNNLSIKVTYNPDIDVWELFYREDPGTAFVDPSTGTYTKAGTSLADAFSTPMTHFGFVAGLQTSTSTGNIYQFDNFKIALSDVPAYTAPPVVEKRQVFNSNPTPTVSSLVGTGTGALNWYDVATGGTALLSTTSLVNGKIYYGSLTVGVTESDRVATTVYVGNTTLKTLPLYENFDYTIGDKLIVMNNAASANAALGTAAGIGLGSWTLCPSSNVTDDVTIVASPTWSNTVLPAAQGNAITFVGSGIDPEMQFTNTTSGSLYSSFVFTAETANIAPSFTTDPLYSAPTGIYSFSSNSLPSIDPITNILFTASNYAASVMFRKNMATGRFNLGLSKSNSSTECVWSPTEFDFGTHHLIVIGYENIGDAVDTNQVANLWIDPASSTQPEATLTQNNPISAADGVTPVIITRSNIDRIRLVQTNASSTPTLFIDEIRVANNWGEAIGGASTLELSPAPTASAQTFCGVATVSSLVATGTDLKWYANATVGTQLIPSDTLTTQTYYVSQTLNTMESARTAVAVTVTAPLTTSAIRMVGAATTVIPTVVIGTQTWTTKNLDVATYSDGTVIPQVQDATAWANLTTGAWCYYNNDPANGAIYGKLYNWYAVAGIYDEASKTDLTLRKKLAPTGYHVPSDSEWTTLTTHLGGESVAGGKMKEIGTAHWLSPNQDATNESGLTGLPGGFRDSNGGFGHIGGWGDWWSFSETNMEYALYLNLHYYDSSPGRSGENKTYGFSVRCLRD